MKCRSCKETLRENFIDLGHAPPSNAYLDKESLQKAEIFYPLKTKVCTKCWLVQTIDYTESELLFDSEYAYLSSTSKSWLKHSKVFSEKIINKNCLNAKSFVIEIAANDGYLLKNFKEANIPCLGIEPTKSTALIAEEKGINIVQEFFCKSLAKELSSQGKNADLIIGNNVYAHVPNINDFTAGLKILLKQEGTICLEFPHIMQLIKFNQFDTIYHEHFSYLSVNSVKAIFDRHDLNIYDVEILNTHGGSLRIYGCHKLSNKLINKSVDEIISQEVNFGLTNIDTYKKSQKKAEQIRDNLINFLINEKNLGRKVACYGAAAKGNTLLNFSGIKSNLISYVCDMAKSKQGKFLPGSHIPIKDIEELKVNPPDTIIVLPWNLSKEINNILKEFVSDQTKIITFIPEFKQIN